MDFIELLKALFIGVVQGITEWLPVSSTGHMIIVDEFITLHVSSEFWSLFLVVIQLGSILAVILLYFNKLNPFARNKTTDERRSTVNLWAKVIVACIPAAIIGILLEDWFDKYLYSAVVVAAALVVYGVAFILIERFKAPKRISGVHVRHTAPQPSQINTVEKLSFGRALGVGFFQCLAIIPGTSRSGSTILGARILGISREAAAEFSFFLAIPVMFGWSFLRVVKTFFIDSITLTTTEWGVFAVGVAVAFVVSILAIRFLMGYIQKHSFEVFGWYRIVLGVGVLAFFCITGQLI